MGGPAVTDGIPGRRRHHHAEPACPRRSDPSTARGKSRMTRVLRTPAVAASQHQFRQARTIRRGWIQPQSKWTVKNGKVSV